jgi:cell filamentation protein, protein adenylyltransferase
MRSGAYIQQTTGYKAFNPTPLPPNPLLNIDQEMLSLNSQADLAIGRLDSLGDFIPDADLFVFMYVRKEAVISSQIEGTQATLVDVLDFEAGNLDVDDRSDVDEVVNYVNAMNYGLEQIGHLNGLPLSLGLIKEIHRRLLTGVRGQNRTPGDFRISQNWIGGTTPSNAIFVPPAVHDMNPALHKFEHYMREYKDLPPLIRTALLHSQFETIHPFLDGNGRVGRLLITFYLCHESVLKRPLLYLSFFLKRNQQEYYDLLQAIRNTSDYEGWVKFFLKGVIETANEAVRTAKAIIELREKDRAKMIQLGRGMRTGSKLLNELYNYPTVTIKTVKRLTGLTDRSANLLVKRFVDLEILEEVTGNRRNRRFSYTPYLDILSTR